MAKVAGHREAPVTGSGLSLLDSVWHITGPSLSAFLHTEGDPGVLGPGPACTTEFLPGTQSVLWQHPCAFQLSEMDWRLVKLGKGIAPHQVWANDG